MVLVILLQILPHKLKIIKTTKKIILKKKNKYDPSGSGNSSSNTNPQIQDNQNHQEDNIKEKEQSDDPRDLLELTWKNSKMIMKKQKKKMKT
ncbi:hypothetical protein HYD70_02305 [Mycoplasmopsis bovis]|nr:hypothetical protein [Mycoplasmopsis bovis]QQH49784.1 hypothetical protein HYD70_02305 [Mycoplasmopsis bovis]